MEGQFGGDLGKGRGEGASSRSMSFANASRNKVFETRARILALAYIRRSFPFRYGPPFAFPLLSSFLIFTSRPALLFSSRVR